MSDTAGDTVSDPVGDTLGKTPGDTLGETSGDAPDDDHVALMPHSVARGLLCGLALAGLAVTGYLAIASFPQSAVAGCGDGSSCATVLASRWSRVGPLPVAVLAVATWLAALAALSHLGPRATHARRRVAWFALLAMAGSLVAAAVWFVFLQGARLHAFCPWCMAAHGVGVTFALVMAVAITFARRSGPRSSGPVASILVAPWLGLAGVGAVAAVQVLLPAPTHELRWASGSDFDRGHDAAREVSFFGGRVRVRPAELPVLGSPEAPYLVAYVYDYTCFHCRATSQQLKQAADVYGRQLAFLMLCAPRDAACNPTLLETPPFHEGACELAALAAAVWQADRTQFAAFHAWLFASETPPTPTEARAHAASLVGEESLAAALDGQFPAQHIKRALAFQHMTERTSLPMLVARNAVIHGRPQSAQVVLDFIAETFEVEAFSAEPVSAETVGAETFGAEPFDAVAAPAGGQ